MTTSARLLAGLVPASHTVHRQPLGHFDSLCPSCVRDNLRRLVPAALLRPYSDGWGNVDVELLMTDLARSPEILQDFLPTEL